MGRNKTTDKLELITTGTLSVGVDIAKTAANYLVKAVIKWWV